MKLEDSVCEIFDLFAMENEWPLKSMKRGNVKDNAITFIENMDDL